jgi:hypothetical protein
VGYIVQPLKRSKRKNIMSKYQANITKNAEGSFYALVVRVEDNGYQAVIAHYAGRHFKTEKAAVKSTSNYIAKFCS